MLAAVVGLGAVVYVKVLRASPENQACDRMGSLCTDEFDVGECHKAFGEAKKLVGEKAVDKAADCIESANSCVEAAGCIAGAATHSLDDFQKGFDRSSK